MNKIIKKQLAFTLIELLVVIAIIGVLSALIVVGMSSTTEKANVARGQVFFNSLKNSMLTNMISEWKLNEVTGSGPPYGTIDSWKINNGTLGDGTCAQGEGACPAFVLDTSGQCASGGCYQFDGTADYIAFSPNTDLNFGTGDFTLAAWFKTDRTTRQHFMGFGSDSTQPNLQFDMNDGGYGLWVYINSSGATTTRTTSSYYDNKWHYIVFLRNAGVLKLYADGTLKDSYIYAGAVDLSSLNYRLGRAGTSSQYFKGFLDDVRIFNAATSLSQIQQNYFIGINKLFAKKQITQTDYQQRLASLRQSVGAGESNY